MNRGENLTADTSIRKLLYAMPKLVFIDKDFAGRMHDLAVQKTTVGRGHDNTLVIGDKSVSEHHAEILVNGMEVIVRDLGSTNGTSVVGVRVAKQHQVHPGQVIRFGSVEARLDFAERELKQQQDHTSDVTAVYEFRRFSKAPPPAPAPPAHDEIVPNSGPPSATNHTMLVSRRAEPEPVVPASPSPQTPKSSTNWLVILLAVIVLAAVTGGVLWIFMHR